MGTSILQVNKYYWPHIGGVEKTVQTLAEGFAQRGFASRVLACGAEDKVEQQGNVEITKLRSSFRISSVPFSLRFPTQYRRLSRSSDVILHHFPNPCGEIAELLSRIRKPKLVLYHSDMVRQKFFKLAYSAQTSWFLRRMDCIIASSPNYLESSPTLRHVRNLVRVIPPSIDPGRFTPDGPMDSRMKKLHEQGLLNVLYVGRFAYYKGLNYLIEAAGKLPPHYRVILAGQGEEKEHLLQLQNRLGLTGQIIFLPPPSDDELPALYRGADLFVLPSVARTEAFGLVGIEAMASGVPVITTELGTGTTYYNQNGVTGLVVQPGNPSMLARAITELGEDPQRIEKGKHARQRVVMEFSHDAVLDRWERLLQEVV